MRGKLALKSVVFKVVIILVSILTVILQSTFVYSLDKSYLTLNQGSASQIGIIPELKDVTSKAGSEIKTESNMTEAGRILTNELGLFRINEERRKKGLEEISMDRACEFGHEVVDQSMDAGPSPSTSLMSMTPYEEIPVDTMPSSVDNSELQSFPPIGHQGLLNSCSAYATTYYQMTHMFGLALGWDVKNDDQNTKKFSPKWTFNLTNVGEDGVMGIEGAFSLFSKCGAVLWSEFPYDGYDDSMENLMEWPTDGTIWRNALNYRIEDYGYVKIWDYSETPVKGPNDPNLNKVKQLLNDGYVLTFATNVSRWRFSKVNDDPSIPEDDGFIDQYIAHITDKPLLTVDGHVMTVVGYNDDLWVDINGNSIVETGEKGAFKIANSWGTYETMESSDGSFVWHSNDGFLWLSYDALNIVSSVPGCPVTERKNAISNSNRVFWVSPKKSYTPKLLIEYTVNHANKYELKTLFGYSDFDTKSPVAYSDPYNINLYTLTPTKKSSFDGTANACDATFVFDISVLYDMHDSAKGNLYLTLIDEAKDNPCTLKDVKIIDYVSGETYNYSGEMPVNFDFTTLNIGPISFKKQVSGLNGSKTGSAVSTSRYFPAVVSANDKIYAIGGIGAGVRYLNTVEEYDTQTDTWIKKKDMVGEQSAKPFAVSINNRIYVIKKLASGEGVIEEYDPYSDKWIYKKSIKYWDKMFVMETDNKIYIVGADDIFDNTVTSTSIAEYDPVLNTIMTKTNMDLGWVPLSCSAVNGEIYIFGSIKYRLGSGLPLWEDPYEVDGRLRLYNPKSDSWDVREETDFNGSEGITVQNGKFYGFYQDPGSDKIGICEYDPVNNITSYISRQGMMRSKFGICPYKDSIVAVGGTLSVSVILRDNTIDAVEIITPDPDKMPPVLEPPQDITVSSAGELTPVDVGTPEVIANSAVTVTNDAPKTFPLGKTVVNWTAVDANGNMTSKSQTVNLYKIGDADGSGAVNSIDFAFMRQLLLGYMSEFPGELGMYAADVDGNSSVNSIDFALMRQYLLGYIDKFPSGD